MRLLRLVVANFLSINSDLEINGLRIDTAINTDDPNVEHFIEQTVKTQGVDAKSVVFIAAPLVFRISLDTLVLDSSDPQSVLVLGLN